MKKQIAINARVAGFYKLEAVRPDGERRLLADWFPNLITDAGLDHIGLQTNYLADCFVGSGNSAPSNSDTTLQSQVASTGTHQSQSAATQPSPPYYGSRQITYRFATGDAAGNLSEVGIGPASGSLFSRALILDGLGSPTTITVLSDEVLDVTYELRQYVPTSDVTGTITIGGVDYDYTLRAANATDTVWYPSNPDAGMSDPYINFCRAYDDVIGAITGQPSGTLNTPTSVGAADSYTNGTSYRNSTVVFGLNDGNDGSGIRSLLYIIGSNLTGYGYFQIDFGAAIPKDNTQVLTFGIRFSWARH